VGLDPRPTHICADLEAKVRWLRERPTEAAAVAQHGRALALRHLARGAVLHDLASLLLGYHALAADTAPAAGAADNAAVWAHLRRQFPQNAYLREAVNAARKVVVVENEEVETTEKSVEKKELGKRKSKKGKKKRTTRRT